jgi:DNA replicative helicase MCM subunit Mcm2 (Cdc46/Mcm family)
VKTNKLFIFNIRCPPVTPETVAEVLTFINSYLDKGAVSPNQSDEAIVGDALDDQIKKVIDAIDKLIKSIRENKFTKAELEEILKKAEEFRKKWKDCPEAKPVVDKLQELIANIRLKLN